MRARHRVLLALLALVVPFGCDGGCSCSSGDVLAELVETTGPVERDHAGEVGHWEEANVEATFRAGDGLRTSREAQAVLTLAAGGQVQVEAETIIRFRTAPPGEQTSALDVEMGDAVLSAGDSMLKLATDVGIAVIEPGATMRVSRTPEGLTFAVTVGRARLEPNEGEAQNLGEGESIEVGIGQAVVEESVEARTEPDASPPPLPAEVTVEVTGSGAASRGPKQSEWQKIAPGSSTLEQNTSVRLAKGTTMTVSGGGQQAMLRGTGQFVVLGPNGALVQVDSGSARVSGSAARARIQAPGGMIVVDEKAAAEIAVDTEGTTIGVTSGSAQVLGKKDTVRVRAGEEATLASDGTVDVSGRGLDYADLVLGAGASAVVHDPSPPTAVGFATECPSGAVIDLDRAGKSRRVRGGKQTNVRVRAGRARYSIHCVREDGIESAESTSGTLTVVRDAGTAPLPRSAPTTQVAADGRNYTVLYQNLLPKIGISWPGAPAAKGYQLAVTSAGRTKTHTTASPSFTFSSGTLSEGTHRLLFTTADGARSKTTTVQIRFDNAAPKASLTAPASRSFSPGEKVVVAGIALPGWAVSAAGVKLGTDGQHRFRGTVTAPTSQRALAVVFNHPRRGAHYYVRRSNSAP